MEPRTLDIAATREGLVNEIFIRTHLGVRSQTDKRNLDRGTIEGRNLEMFWRSSQ